TRAAAADDAGHDDPAVDPAIAAVRRLAWTGSARRERMARAQVGPLGEPRPPDAVLHELRGTAGPARRRQAHVRPVRRGLLSPAREPEDVQRDHHEVRPDEDEPRAAGDLPSAQHEREEEEGAPKEDG